MPTVYYGKKGTPGFELAQSKDLIAVRTRSRRSIARSAGPVFSRVAAELEGGTLVLEFPEAGVEVYRVPVQRGARSMAERKAALRMAPDVRFAGGVLVNPGSDEPVLYTENLFLKFIDSADPDDCLQAIQEVGLSVKEAVSYATNGYFVAAPEGTGQEVFEIATRLLDRADVEYCYPELIRRLERKAVFPQQWHLGRSVIGGVTVDAHANVEAAHAVAQGEGVTIAIIDDGVDIDHPEFAGAGKVVSPRDVTRGIDDPRPKDPDPRFPDDHGTACAGVACGNGAQGASGVAPKARLMPIRLASGLGSMREADAFQWAADHGADVISCSWGPPDGRWWDPDDSSADARFPLPPHTRMAIQNAVTLGRDGKGCVILFAAGNGNELMDSDEYASNSNVIAVASCNDRGKRSVYSDFGKAVWCAFPSGDFGDQDLGNPEPLTSGIWTTDRLGRAGYNAGSLADGDAGGSYTNSFSGTSSSCPGAAGVAALALSVNPALKWHEVKDLLRRGCDKIDPQGGVYDNKGHSLLYGHGRLNARTAVELAQAQPQSAVTIQRTFDAPIPDLQTVSFALTVPDATSVQALTASVDLRHTYIGDLVITLKPPAATGQGPVVLHQRAGGSTQNLRRTYDQTSTPGLAAFAGRSCAGEWTLEIRDAAAQDSGTLVSFALGLTFVHPSRAVAPESATRAKSASKSASTDRVKPASKGGARSAGRKVKRPARR